MKTLLESINMAEIESIFRQQAKKVWKDSPLLTRIQFSFVAVPRNEMKKGVLMSLSYAYKPMAIGGHLISVPPTMTLRVNERVDELTPEQLVKIIIHEACHIGYLNHDQNFISLCVAHGGAPSELSATEDGYKVQEKQGGRFKTVKVFPITTQGQIDAKAFGMGLVKQGKRARIVI